MEKHVSFRISIVLTSQLICVIKNGFFVSENLSKMKFILSRFKVFELENFIFRKYCDKNWEDVIEEFAENEEPVQSKRLSLYFSRRMMRKSSKEIFEMTEKFMLIGMCIIKF